ncbi:nuclear transport factor 2A-like isoform X4 [Zingiber officinale]|uniref:nuclear transport factor 2A-like isoform X4 n=1 Tax=Zingiber officinale TaxID=94328 RepID=UPI001C4D3AB3|nr:nuclear transport factor 2A-like isoform X4 [Zingiber officinale]
MDTYAIFKDYRLLFDVFGRAFAEHYYRTFESNPQALVGLYLDYSMLTFEGEKIQGAAAIVSKLTSHPFQQCAHAISTVDCQPSGFSGGVLVVVNGFLLLGGEQHPRMFSQDYSLLSSRPLGDQQVISEPNCFKRINHRPKHKRSPDRASTHLSSRGNSRTERRRLRYFLR